MDIKELAEKYIKQRSVIMGASLFLAIIIILILFSAAVSLFKDKPESSSFSPGIGRYDESLPDFTVDSSDFLFPEEFVKLPEFHWKQYRTVKDRWTAEEVERFWIDPAEIIRDIYSEINEKELEKLLEDVP